MSSTNSTAHTAGPWIPNLDTMFIRLPDGRPVASVYGDHPECLSDECGRARTILIAEAGTVAHETGLTPRQLADRLQDFRDVAASAANAFDILADECRHDGDGRFEAIWRARAEKARAALAAAKGGAS